MRAAVDLDDQSLRHDREVHDVRPDWVLTTNGETLTAQLAQGLPGALLGDVRSAA